MKSRWTIYLLTIAVIIIWGAVIWRIFTPTESPPPIVDPMSRTEVFRYPRIDSLRLNYPNPFLKEDKQREDKTDPISQNDSFIFKPRSRTLDSISILHIGTLKSNEEFTLYIIKISDSQYEMVQGDTAANFILIKSDQDSLYLKKEGIIYGVKQYKP